jgi:hypothetical protein
MVGFTSCNSVSNESYNDSYTDTRRYPLSFENGKSYRTKNDTKKFQDMKLPPSSSGTSKGETYSGRPVRKNKSDFLNEMSPLLTVSIFCPSSQSKNKSL